MEHRLLSVLDDDARRAVLAKTVRRRYPKDDTLFHEGDPGETLHLLERGRVAIRIGTDLGDVATLAVLGPGDSFGEQALLDAEARRTASVVALEPVETRALVRRDFEALLDEHPRIERLLVEMLAGQVRRLSAHLMQALYLSVEERVVHRLRDLARIYDAGDATIVIPLRQDDVASMAGTTRPTVNRILKHLVDEGVLALRRGKIEIIDPATLLARLG